MCGMIVTHGTRLCWMLVGAVLLATLAAGCSGPERAQPEAVPAVSAIASVAVTPTPPATAPPPTVLPATELPPTQPPATAQPTSAVAACAPGVDLLGFSDALDKTSVDGVPVGNISAIAWEGGDRYLGLSDRDGIVYRIAFPLDGTPNADGVLRLTDADGQPWGEDAIDGEGLAIDGDDLLVASEVGPEIGRYTSDGRLVGTLPVPQRFLVAPNGQGTLNETFESLSLAPDGQTLWTANERPLTGDGVDVDGRGRVRLIRYQRPSGDFAPAGEFAYLLEPDQGLSELLVLGDGDLLTLERGLSLSTGFTARIYRVKTGGATDVSDIDALDGADFSAASKELVVDLGACPVSPGGGAPGPFSPLLDNFEGMTFGPDQGDGRHSLILISDDNGQSLQVTRIVVLAIDPRLLP